jgi:pyruvate/2-oxoglutarate dehydrogenase complex dihydrolipoamide dehydrogenase (E3) component
MDKVAYMPDAKPITVKLVADKKSGRILGAQGVGEGDVDKRINIVTSALQKNMTVEELLHLDLTYTPTTSGAIDPLLTACYELKKQM